MKLDWLILGDHAEVINGKLYLHGGGWDRLTVNTGFPVRQPMALAAAFRVPWMETNQRHKVELQVVDQDHDQRIASVTGEMEVGRPAGIEHGSDQRALLAVNVQVPFDRPDRYEVLARIDDEAAGQVSFSVIPGPTLALQQFGERK